MSATIRRRTLVKRLGVLTVSAALLAQTVHVFAQEQQPTPIPSVDDLSAVQVLDVSPPPVDVAPVDATVDVARVDVIVIPPDLTVQQIIDQGMPIEPSPPPVYSPGFDHLSSFVDMGAPLENEHVDSSGDYIIQLTTNGMAYYLPDQNQVSFFDGYQRSALNDDGQFISWLSNEMVAPDPPVPAPAPVAVPEPVASDPQSYLRAIAPAGTYNLLSCIVRAESGWNPNAINRSSSASGLFQFLPSTWRATPEGRAGYSPFNWQANLDAGVWLYQTYGPRQWETYTRGICK